MRQPVSMRLRDIALALLVVSFWGSNFVVIKLGLRGMPPLFFTTLRFACAALPLALFVRRPRVPLRLLVAWGLAQFAIQFALLFSGIALGMPAGLASLVIQLQAFFTIGLARLVLGEHARANQLLGAAIALGGMGVVAAHMDHPGTLLGLMLVIGAATSWACANIVVKRIGGADALSLAVWGSVVACVPLALATVVIEGWPTVAATLRGMGWSSWGAVLFQSYPNTLFGFGVWALLMRRYAAAQVAPFTLLVPVVGMGCAAVVLDEPLPAWKLFAGALVLGGLALNQLPPGVARRLWRAA